MSWGAQEEEEEEKEDDILREEASVAGGGRDESIQDYDSPCRMGELCCS